MTHHTHEVNPVLRDEPAGLSDANAARFSPSLRPPDEEEIKQLKQYLFNKMMGGEFDEEEATGLLGDAYIAVFPDYVTGGPGYFGRVMIVVYDGSPGFVESYCWDKDEIRLAGSYREVV
jgi:hypothetical protein